MASSEDFPVQRERWNPVPSGKGHRGGADQLVLSGIAVHACEGGNPADTLGRAG
jgi:hypothetical protein